jgi:hypothetical protein
MTMKVYGLYAVNIINTGTPANSLYVDHIIDWSFSPGVANTIIAADGMVDPTFIAVGSQAPSASFSTLALATVLASCGLDGLAIESSGADLYLQQYAEGATRTAGGTHMRLRVAEGLLVPRAISVSQGGNATLPLELIPTWDGTNNPVVITTNSALTGTPAVDEVFTLGPISINGAQVEGVLGMTIDPGIQLMAVGADGSIWPKFVAIASRAPSIRVQVADASVLSTFGLYGTAQSASDSKFYLRKRLEGGTVIDDATEENISFTIDEGMIQSGQITASHGGHAQAELVITPTYDGSNAIIAIDTACAIVIP